ncbi:MAG: hypothetical protein WCC10_00340, partial [Tumebacillaceae bacterium]
MTDDYYNFNEKQYCLIGERTGRIFRIGDKVRIKVMNANKIEGTIDFELLGQGKAGERRGGGNERESVKVKGKKYGRPSGADAGAGKRSSGAGGNGGPGRKKRGGGGAGGSSAGGTGGGRKPKELQELKQVIGKSRKNKSSNKKAR